MELSSKFGPAFSGKRKWLAPLLILLGLAAAAAGISAYHWLARARIAPVLTVEVNLLNPDAFLDTQSLAKLPRDLLKAPVLGDLATEDMFFYYREDEGRLGLEGALRRIAFEHQLELGDRVISSILDRPARIAFWKSRDGRLGRWLMIVNREGLAPVLESLAKAALPDSQLSIAGTLPGHGGPQVFELRHGPDLKIYFASVGDHLFIFSDAGILLNTGSAELERVNRLLDAANPADIWLQFFHLDGASGTHTLAVSANYLSQGYQALFPALHALRFDYGDNGWTAEVSAVTPYPKQLMVWSAVPDHPALCVALPVDTERLAVLLSKLVAVESARRLADALEPPAAVCWYDKAKPYAPLLAIRKKSETSLKDTLPELFKIAIGALEAGAAQSPPPAVPAGQAENDGATKPPPVIHHPPFEIAEENLANGAVWRREVSSPYGPRPSEESEHADDMRSANFFTVALAEWKDVLLFSPDTLLVDDAMAVLEGRYPSLADALPQEAETAAIVYPDHLADMVKTAVLDSLPETQEPLFRANVSERLLPGLEKTRSGKLTRLSAPAGKTAWEPLKWSEQP